MAKIPIAKTPYPSNLITKKVIPVDTSGSFPAKVKKAEEWLDDSLEDKTFGALDVLRYLPPLAKAGLLLGAGYLFSLGIQKKPLETWTGAGLTLAAAVAYRAMKSQQSDFQYSHPEYDILNEIGRTPSQVDQYRPKHLGRFQQD